MFVMEHIYKDGNQNPLVQIPALFKFFNLISSLIYVIVVIIYLRVLVRTKSVNPGEMLKMFPGALSCSLGQANKLRTL